MHSLDSKIPDSVGKQFWILFGGVENKNKNKNMVPADEKKKDHIF